MKKFLSLLLISFLVVSMLSCNLFEPEEKVFEKAGLSMTLNEDFTEKDHVSYTAVYVSTKIEVCTLKEDFESLNLSKDTDTNEYAKLVIQANKLTCEPTTKDGLTYFQFEKEVKGKNFTYYGFVYKGSDAFWLVQFGCESDKTEKYEDDIFKYAKSVTVK